MKTVRHMMAELPKKRQARIDARAKALIAEEMSLQNLRSFPWIAEPEAAGTLALHGMRFGIESGQLMELRGEAFVAVT